MEKKEVEIEVAPEQGTEQPVLTGRSKFGEMYRKKNPDFEGEPDDETLYGFIDTEYSDIEGKYNKQNEANKRLAEQVSKNPQLGALLSMISGEEPKSLAYAIGSIYGKDAIGLEGDELEEFERGNSEYVERLNMSESERKQASENFQNFVKSFDQYVSEKGYDDKRKEDVFSGIMDVAENMLTGNIPMSVVELIDKGLNYDQDVQEAADTGFVEGKNEVVRDKIEKRSVKPDVMPDLAAGTGAGNERKVARKSNKPKDFFDVFKEV